MPLKADHGKKPYIVYQGVLQENIKQKLQDKVDELISKDLKFSWEFQPYEALQKEAIYLQEALPRRCRQIPASGQPDEPNEPRPLNAQT